jgi:polysaccharide export outer membrane protein
MLLKLRHIALLVAAAGIVASCTIDRSAGLAPGVELTQLETLPPPPVSNAYVIGPQEVLQIDVVGAPTLSGTFLTDVDGKLAFPLAGTLDIAGKSPGEAGRIIADALRGPYVRDPQVRVLPKELPAPTISVGGQVRKPGNYPSVGQPTLLRLVNQAEGLTEYARLDDVLIMRTVAGQRYIGVYNLGAIQRGNYADPQLYANDIVMVGESAERRRLELLLQVLPPIITTAAILIVQ